MMPDLHPQSKSFLHSIAIANSKPWYEMPLAEAREGYLATVDHSGDVEDIASVQDIQLDGRKARRYDNQPTTSSPTVFFFHGGGWVLGDLDTHDRLCRRIAKFSNCTVIAIDYRRSPETTHPIPIEDCFGAMAEAISRFEALELDCDRMAVAGDSAGGYLAAQIALKCQQLQRSGDVDWALKLQLLIYPVIEPDFETESYRLFESDHGLTRKSMQWFWDQYRGTVPLDDSSLSPLAAETLEGLAPAHIMTASHDVLRDDGVAYAQALEDAGIPVTHCEYKGMLHGFVHMAGLFDAGMTAAEDIGLVLRKHLQPPTDKRLDHLSSNQKTKDSAP